MKTAEHEGSLDSTEESFKSARELAGAFGGGESDGSEVELGSEDRVYELLVDGVKQYGVDQGDGLYWYVPTNDEHVGTLQVDTYLNAFHSGTPEQAERQPIFCIQRAHNTGSGPGYNFVMFRGEDLDQNNFLVSQLAKAAQGCKPDELVAVKALDSGGYGAINTRTDEAFRQIVRYFSLNGGGSRR